MTAKPAPRRGWEAFSSPAQVNQRRYEAVRAYLLEGAPLVEAAARFGYTPAALASLVRDFRAGKLALFADPGTPQWPCFKLSVGCCRVGGSGSVVGG